MGDEQSRHWDIVCIGMMTLSTAVIAGMFGLLGLGNVPRKTPLDPVEIAALLAAAVAIILYLACLMHGTNALLDTASGDAKFAKTRQLIHTFYVMVAFVVLVAGFTIAYQLGNYEPCPGKSSLCLPSTAHDQPY